jgi:TatA/E family protein of Tat protein translocase
MFGFWQIVIVLVIVLILFNYKRLPGLGRSAGEGVNQLKGSATEMMGEHKLDASSLGKSAGKGVREFRELKDALSGSAEAKPAGRPAVAAEPHPDPAAPEAQEEPAQTEKPVQSSGESDEPEPVEGELVDRRPA